MLIKGRINFQPKPHQLAVLQCEKRHRCAVMHRRAGKTVMAIYAGLAHMLTCRLPYPRVAYIAPYLKQAKKIAWNYLATSVARSPLFDINRGELSITFLPTGGQFQLWGADNIDALRGTYLDMAIVDELADCDPQLWSAVLRYCLADRQGRALMMGTPRGRVNMLYDLSKTKADDPDWAYFCFPHTETGMLDGEEIASIRRDPNVSEALFAQELECSFNAALIGAIYGQEMNRLQSERRYTSVLYDETLPVMTSWDLGYQDATAVVHWQRVGSEYRVLLCREYELTKLPDIIKDVRSAPWAHNYLAHYGPHDLAVTEYGSGKSRWQIANENGIEFEPTVNWNVEDGVEAVRALLPHVWIAEPDAERMLECLCNYRFAFDSDNRSFKTKPLHDWTSHVADATRMFAVANDPSLLRREPAKRTGRRGVQGELWLR